MDTVVVIGHDDCGGRLLDPKEMIAKMKERGISQEAIDHVDENHKNVEQWLTGFGDINHSVQSTVDAIREHPLLPKDLEVLGFIMDPIRAQSAAFPREKNKIQKVAFRFTNGGFFLLWKIYKIPLDRMDIQLYVINKHTLVGKRGEPHGKTEITRYRAQGHAGNLAYRIPCQHLCRPRGAAKGTPLEFIRFADPSGQTGAPWLFADGEAGQKPLLYPLVTEEDYLAEDSRRYFQKWTGGSLRDLVACLYVNHSVTKEDLEELKAFIEDETEGELPCVFFWNI